MKNRLHLSVLSLLLALFVSSCKKENSANQDPAQAEIKTETHEEHGDAHGDHPEENRHEKVGEKHEGEGKEVAIPDSTAKELGLSLGDMQNKVLDQKKPFPALIVPQAEGQIQVHANLSGQVQKILVRRGQAVSAGTVLAQIQSPEWIEIQTDYLREKADFEALDAEWQRQKRLQSESVQSPREMEKVKQDWKKSKVNLASLEARIRALGQNPNAISAQKISALIAVKASSSGIVQEMDARLGAYVETGAELFDLVRSDAVQLEIQYRGQILGQGSWTLLDADGRSFVLKNPRALPALDAEGVQRFLVDLPNGRWVMGQKLQVFYSETVARSALPDSAIASFQGKTTAFAAKKEKGEWHLRAIPVQTGSRLGSWTAIEGNPALEEGEQWVIGKAWSVMALFENGGENKGHAH